MRVKAAYITFKVRGDFDGFRTPRFWTPEIDRFWTQERTPKLTVFGVFPDPAGGVPEGVRTHPGGSGPGFWETRVRDLAVAQILPGPDPGSVYD